MAKLVDVLEKTISKEDFKRWNTYLNRLGDIAFEKDDAHEEFKALEERWDKLAYFIKHKTGNGSIAVSKEYAMSVKKLAEWNDEFTIFANEYNEFAYKINSFFKDFVAKSNLIIKNTKKTNEVFDYFETSLTAFEAEIKIRNPGFKERSLSLDKIEKFFRKDIN